MTQMNKTRLEAFSDGVLAIIITIMVLELKVPHGSSFSDLKPMISVFLSYVLSFIYIGIYWNNHHHLLQAANKVNGKILWANLHLLFWLSLIPFTTGWMGENHFASHPISLYGINLLFAAISYIILQSFIIKHHGNDHILAESGRKRLERKGFNDLVYNWHFIFIFCRMDRRTLFRCCCTNMAYSGYAN